MLQKLQGGNTSPLRPAGRKPGGAYSQGQEAGRYGKGYTSSVDGMCSNAWGRSRRKGGRSDNGLNPPSLTGSRLKGYRITPPVKLHVVVAGDRDGSEVQIP